VSGRVFVPYDRYAQGFSATTLASFVPVGHHAVRAAASLDGPTGASTHPLLGSGDRTVMSASPCFLCPAAYATGTALRLFQSAAACATARWPLVIVCPAAGHSPVDMPTARAFTSWGRCPS